MISETLDGEAFKAIYATDSRAGMHHGEQLPLMVAKAIIEYGVDDFSTEELLANARLIAAAPTMYEALKNISEYTLSQAAALNMPDDQWFRSVVSDMQRIAFAALARIEGR